MKIENLIEGKKYLWTMSSGEGQVVTFLHIIATNRLENWYAKFTNGVELSERVVNFAVSEIKVTSPTLTPHIHAKEMIAFAKGHEVEVYAEYDDKWHVVPSLFWNLTDKYRVKKDNSGKIALIEKAVAQLNEEIETRQVKKQGWLKCLQELQS